MPIGLFWLQELFQISTNLPFDLLQRRNHELLKFLERCFEELFLAPNSRVATFTAREEL